MSAENARSKQRWIMEETGGPGVIADATGATALFVPAELAEDSFSRNERTSIGRTFATGRRKRKPARRAAKKATIPFKAMMAAFASSVGTATNPPPATYNWIEIILRSIFGAPSPHNAGVVQAGSDVNTLNLSQLPAIGDLVAIRAADTNGGRVMWGRAQQGANPIDISPDFPAVPQLNDVSYATRTFKPLVDPGESLDIGNTFTIIDVYDGDIYAHPLCRPTALSIVGVAGEGVSLEGSIMSCGGKIRQDADFANLPDAPIEDPDPMIMLESEVIVAGESLDVASVRLDLGLVTAIVKATRAENGVGNIRVIDIQPTLTIDPINDTDLADLFDDETIVSVMIKFGIGDLIDGALNSICFHCEGMQVQDPTNESNDSGIIRLPLVLVPTDVAASGYQAAYFRLGFV